MIIIITVTNTIEALSIGRRWLKSFHRLNTFNGRMNADGMHSYLE